MSSLSCNSEIIRVERDGVEYFTLVDNGRSGMSQSGLARCSGVTEGGIRKLVESLRTKAPSETLEPFAGKTLEELTLRANSSYHNARILKDTFCAAVITHYARHGNAEAAMMLCSFGAAGIRLFIQQITGWQKTPQVPTDYLEALKALVRSEEEKIALTVKTQQQAVLIEQLEPKARVATVLSEANGCYSMQEVAQLLNIPGLGRNNLFTFLKQNKFLINTYRAYQKYIELGIFMIRTYTNEYGSPKTQVLVTPKGVQYLFKKLEECGYKSLKLEQSS